MSIGAGVEDRRLDHPDDLAIVLGGEPEFVIAAWPGDGLLEPFRKAFGLGFVDDVGYKGGVVTASVLPGLGAAFSVASPDLPDRE